MHLFSANVTAWPHPLPAHMHARMQTRPTRTEPNPTRLQQETFRPLRPPPRDAHDLQRGGGGDGGGLCCRFRRLQPVSQLQSDECATEFAESLDALLVIFTEVDKLDIPDES